MNDRREVDDMDVRDIMSRNPITIEPDTPVGAAIAVMVERKIGPLPVVDEQRAVIGIIPDRDLRSLAMAPAAEPYLSAAARRRLRGMWSHRGDGCRDAPSGRG